MISWVPGSGSFTVLCPVVGSKGGGKDRQAARKKICTVKLKPCGVLGIHSAISTLDYKHPGRFVISFRFLPINPNPPLVSVLPGRAGFAVLGQELIKYGSRKKPDTKGHTPYGSFYMNCPE